MEREKTQSVQDYTYYPYRQRTYTRFDIIWVSKKIGEAIVSAAIENRIRSDHALGNVMELKMARE